MSVAVQTSKLCHVYGDRRALDEVDLEVNAGEVFGLLGPNGGGKSTLFRILSTLMVPTQGAATVFGKDVVRDASAVRQDLGVVFQMPSLDAKLRVIENLEIHGRLFGLRGRELTERCNALLERFGVSDRARDVVGTLSGGLARRVEIAKGMVSRPKLLLLDEPSTGLDPGVRRELRDLLFDVRDTDGATILWTTHMLDEADACDRIAILDEGKRIALGTPSELKADCRGASVVAEVADLASADRVAVEYSGEVVGGAVRCSVDDLVAAHALAQKLTGELGDRLLAVTIGRASLEDVFLAKTGKSLQQEPVAPTPAGGRRG